MNKKMARARLLEAQAATAAEREARERQNIEDLAMFMVSTAKADGVDEWLESRIETVRQQADARRLKFRVEAGKALQAMRFRGETVSGIAAQAGIIPARVREYLKLATTEQTTGTAGEPPGAFAEQLEVVPNESRDRDDGQVPPFTKCGAQSGRHTDDLGVENARVLVGACGA